MPTTIRLSSLLILLVLLAINQSCSGEKIRPKDLEFSAQARGCGNFFVYKYAQNQLAGLVVNGRTDELGLEDLQEHVFELPDEHITVKVDKFRKKLASLYCDDVIEPGEEPVNTYLATSGTVRIRILEGSMGPDDTYKVNVLIEQVELEDDKGDKITIESESFENVVVGWLPG